MKKILITGGTTFVSKFTAKYFVELGYDVYVINRGTKEQISGVNLIKCDRHELGDLIEDQSYDAVLDITSYNADDINALLDGLGSFGTYIFISSSAVYPETGTQPFREESTLAENKFWGRYGTDKIAAEKALLSRVPDAYILRPPYLYGPMNNVYRETFVFDCARADRKFYLPGNGDMKLQFFHVEDLCKLMEIIISTKPEDHIMNVGNEDAVTIKEWVNACYNCLGKIPEYVNVTADIEQRLYFSFYNYEYYLDVSKMLKLLPATKSLGEGLLECAAWYEGNESEVRKKPMLEYIDNNLAKQ